MVNKAGILPSVKMIDFAFSKMWKVLIFGGLFFAFVRYKYYVGQFERDNAR